MELSEAAKEARRAYLRKWRKEHPEKAREYERRRWEKVAAQIMSEVEERKGSGKNE